MASNLLTLYLIIHMNLITSIWSYSYKSHWWLMMMDS